MTRSHALTIGSVGSVPSMLKKPDQPNKLYFEAVKLETAGKYAEAADVYDVEADWWEEHDWRDHYYVRIAREDAARCRRSALQVSTERGK